MERINYWIDISELATIVDKMSKKIVELSKNKAA
jgi:hypothetical protein